MNKQLELAKQLAKSLAECEEFLEYQKAKKILEEHEAARIMLEDFRKKQWEFEKKKIEGAQDLKAAEEELQKLAGIIGVNPYVRNYLTAEFRLSQLLMEIQRIIGEAVGISLPKDVDAQKG